MISALHFVSYVHIQCTFTSTYIYVHLYIEYKYKEIYMYTVYIGTYVRMNSQRADVKFSVLF
jgi:hypothetical protein